MDRETKDDGRRRCTKSKCFIIFKLHEGMGIRVAVALLAAADPRQEDRTVARAGRDAVSRSDSRGGLDVAPGNNIDLQHGIGRWHVGRH